MEERIRKFLQSDSEISEQQILAEYLSYLSVDTAPDKNLTQIDTINAIIDADHELAPVISRLLEFNITIHNFMYVFTTSDNWRQQITFRAFVSLLRDWFLKSGHSSVEFIEIKQLAGSDIEQLFKSIYVTCETDLLQRIVSGYGISLPDTDGPQSIASALFNKLHDYLFEQ